MDSSSRGDVKSLLTLSVNWNYGFVVSTNISDQSFNTCKWFNGRKTAKCYFFFNLRHVLLNSGDRRISSAIIGDLHISLYYTEVITHKNSILVRLSKISRGKLEKLFPWRNLEKEIQYVVLNRTRRICSVYYARMDREEYRKCRVCQV